MGEKIKLEGIKHNEVLLVFEVNSKKDLDELYASLDLFDYRIIKGVTKFHKK